MVVVVGTVVVLVVVVVVGASVVRLFPRPFALPIGLFPLFLPLPAFGG